MNILELGGGDNRQEGVTCMVDVRPGPQVDFVADLNQPLPMQDNEWDVVLAIYVIEHLSWRTLPLFLAEVFRITKPGGKIQLVTANTEAQMAWIKNQKFEDSRKAFEQCSCILFGDQDYPENTHRLFLSPLLFYGLLEQAGFSKVQIKVVGSTQTDMLAEAVKPEIAGVVVDNLNKEVVGAVVEQITPAQLGQPVVIAKPGEEVLSPEQLYDFAYFNGGGKVGGYAREGYWDYPVHQITANHILATKPSSVMELGAARGYVLKRIQDAGAIGVGLEVSQHCFMTRVADGIVRQDLLDLPWKVKDGAIDLIYSVAVLEHIPEEALPHIIKEMARISHRCLHGVDFGSKDDGFDKTHCTLKPKEWWQDMFAKHYLHKTFSILDKEDLEKGSLPEDYIKGDGKLKLNIGCATTMYHHGWQNMDVLDLKGFAQYYGYHFSQVDVRNGLPCGTGTVDFAMLCHFLEHLSYDEGVKFLRECRRVIKPEGAMRIIVPDGLLLMDLYINNPKALADFNHINEGCKHSKTTSGKLWSLLHEGHAMAYDFDSLHSALQESGWHMEKKGFREGHKQILAETLDLLPCLSLYADAYPRK